MAANKITKTERDTLREMLLQPIVQRRSAMTAELLELKDRLTPPAKLMLDFENALNALQDEGFNPKVGGRYSTTITDSEPVDFTVRDDHPDIARAKADHAEENAVLSRVQQEITFAILTDGLDISELLVKVDNLLGQVGLSR